MYRIESVGGGMEGEGTVNLAVAGDVVVSLHIPVKSLVVVIVPQAALRAVIPRQGTKHLTTAGKLV